jgi:hypothetical protein
VLYVLAGWDPMVRLFFWLGTTGAFGVLCLLATTSLAVIRFFAVAAAVGVGYGVWLRSSRPDVYQAIGLGTGP